MSVCVCSSPQSWCVLEQELLAAYPLGKSSELIVIQSVGKAVTQHTAHPIPFPKGETVTTCKLGKKLSH